jgi:hypothetical protein
MEGGVQQQVFSGGCRCFSCFRLETGGLRELPSDDEICALTILWERFFPKQKIKENNNK